MEKDEIRSIPHRICQDKFEMKSDLKASNQITEHEKKNTNEHHCSLGGEKTFLRYKSETQKLKTDIFGYVK